MAIPYGSTKSATQTSFVVELTSQDGGGLPQNNTRYLDVGQCLSLINRKLHRQMQLYPVQLQIEHNTSVSSGTYQSWRIEAAPNTYLVRQAIKFAFENWLASTKDARSNTREARWMDFKIFLDNYQYSQGDKNNFNNLLPIQSSLVNTAWDLAGISNPFMQWQPTLIDSPDTGVDFHFQLFGSTDGDEFGILNEYEKSYKLNIASPDPTQFPAPMDTPYEDAFAQLSPESAYMLASRGSSPPYDPDMFQICIQQFWIGIQNLSNVSGSAASLFQHTTTPWFIAPMGLLKITNVSDETPTNGFKAKIRVNVLHGRDKGINTGMI